LTWGTAKTDDGVRLTLSGKQFELYTKNKANSVAWIAMAQKILNKYRERSRETGSASTKD